MVSYISPHSLTARALVVAPGDVLHVGNAAGREPVEVAVDGDQLADLAAGRRAGGPLRRRRRPPRPAAGHELLPADPREVRPPRRLSRADGSRFSRVAAPWSASGGPCVLVSIATFMLLLDVTVVNVALPDIQRELNASLSSLQWVVDAYSLTLAAFLLTAGSLGDRLGRRRVFTIGFGIFTFASFLCGIAERPDPAQPRPRPAGHRRRRHVRHLAGADRPGVPRQRPGDGVRRLGGDGRRRGRDRAAGRRRHHREPRLGVDLLRQRPDRDRGDGPDRAQDRQRLRQGPGADRRSRASSPSRSRSSC